MEEDGKIIGNSQLLATMVQNSVGGELYAIQTEKSIHPDMVIPSL